MIIEFNSKYGIGENKKEIKFSSILRKTVEDNITILEFEEPSNKVLNRIEFDENKVSIIAGITNLHLEKDKEIKNIFSTEGGDVILITKLNKFNIQNHEIEIKYDLFSLSKEKINEFEINLKIK